MPDEELTILGRTVTGPIDADKLETFQAPPNVIRVACHTEEMTSLCPKTGQPDYYECTIDYCPDKKCVESKSLKLYLMRYRNTGQFIEDLVETIAEDLFTVLAPVVITVTLTMAPRGGIGITAQAVRKKEEDPGFSMRMVSSPEEAESLLSSLLGREQPIGRFGFDDEPV